MIKVCLLVCLLVLDKSNSRYLPSSFDLSLLPSANNCDFNLPDEGVCGANWRYTLSQTLQNVLCLNKHLSLTLSPQHLLDCSPNSDCQHFDKEEQIETAFNYIKYNGLTSLQCYPDNSHLNITPNKCKTTCQSTSIKDSLITSQQLFKANWYKMTDANLTIQVQYYLMNVGPVVLLYKNNQQFLTTLEMIGQQDQIVQGLDNLINLGWKTVQDRVYWTCANTYGSNWADNGYVQVDSISNYVLSYYAFSLPQDDIYS